MLAAKTRVDLFHDLPYSRQAHADKFFAPFFESLAHNRMVGVRDRVYRDIPRLFPAESVFVH